MKVIDNFLNSDDAENLKAQLLNGNIPWFISDSVAVSKTNLKNKSYYDKIKDIPKSTPSNYCFQFTHGFYSDYIPRSNFIEIIDPIIRKLQPAAIARIKANLNLITPEHYFKDAWHTDIENFRGKTAVYYVNSNNGYTEFEDGKTVESVENRIAIFDASILHTGITCTDTKHRCVININYFE